MSHPEASTSGRTETHVQGEDHNNELRVAQKSTQNGADGKDTGTSEAKPASGAKLGSSADQPLNHTAANGELTGSVKDAGGGRAESASGAKLGLSADQPLNHTAANGELTGGKQIGPTQNNQVDPGSTGPPAGEHTTDVSPEDDKAWARLQARVDEIRRINSIPHDQHLKILELEPGKSYWGRDWAEIESAFKMNVEKSARIPVLRDLGSHYRKKAVMIHSDKFGNFVEELQEDAKKAITKLNDAHMAILKEANLGVKPPKNRTDIIPECDEEFAWNAFTKDSESEAMDIDDGNPHVQHGGKLVTKPAEMQTYYLDFTDGFHQLLKGLSREESSLKRKPDEKDRFMLSRLDRNDFSKSETFTPWGEALFDVQEAGRTSGNSEGRALVAQYDVNLVQVLRLVRLATHYVAREDPELMSKWTQHQSDSKRCELRELCRIEQYPYDRWFKKDLLPSRDVPLEEWPYRTSEEARAALEKHNATRALVPANTMAGTDPVMSSSNDRFKKSQDAMSIDDLASNSSKNLSIQSSSPMRSVSPSKSNHSPPLRLDNATSGQKSRPALDDDDAPPSAGGISHSKIDKTGITQMGKIIAVRKANNFGYYMLVNAGTENYPVLRMFTGSDFGLAAGKDCYDSDLAKPGYTRHSTDLRRNDLLKTVGFVEVPCSPSRQNKPIAFFLVELEAKGDRPTEQMVPRSLYYKLLGRASADAAEQTLKGKAIRQEQWVRKCIRRGYHPDGPRREMTEDDKQRQPWLTDANFSEYYDHKRGVRGAERPPKSWKGSHADVKTERDGRAFTRQGRRTDIEGDLFLSDSEADDKGPSARPVPTRGYGLTPPPDTPMSEL